MHETSIATAIIGELDRIANGRRIAWVKLRIGRLRMIDEESLRFALDVLSKGTVAEGMEVRIEWEEPRLKCETCGYIWTATPGGEYVGHFYPELLLQLCLFKCPRCGSTSYRIEAGRELSIAEVAVEDSSPEVGPPQPSSP